MFGPDDAFLTTILELLRRLPIYPMFGRGRTRLQPAYVEDVAEAIARALQRTQTHAITFECGGPRVYSYEELLRALARDADLKRIFSTPVRGLAGTGMDRRTAPESARHPQSGGADAGR
jgi:NADH dehydrogenase